MLMLYWNQGGGLAVVEAILGKSDFVKRCNRMLKSNGIVPSKLPCGYVPIDMDVSPFDNSKTSKEGVFRSF